MTSEHVELDELGILRQTKLPKEYAWLDSLQREFLLSAYLGQGTPKRVVQKFKDLNPQAFIEMDVRGLVEWETDKAGRPVVLQLTWKGRDVAEILVQIAKNENNKTLNNFTG